MQSGCTSHTGMMRAIAASRTKRGECMTESEASSDIICGKRIERSGCGGKREMAHAYEDPEIEAFPAGTALPAACPHACRLRTAIDGLIDAPRRDGEEGRGVDRESKGAQGRA